VNPKHRAPASTQAHYRAALASGLVLLSIVTIVTAFRMEAALPDDSTAPLMIAAETTTRLPVYTPDGPPPVIGTTHPAPRSTPQHPAPHPTPHPTSSARHAGTTAPAPTREPGRPAARPSPTPAPVRPPVATSAPAQRPRTAPAPAPRPPAPAPDPRPAAASSAAPALGALGARIVAYARVLAGQHIPYVFGGKTLAGLDCSGFVWYVLNHVGHPEPYRMSGELKAWAKSIPASAAVPGDLVFYPGHVAIFVGNGRIIDAGSSVYGVTERALWPGATFGRIPDNIP
jgi:cell wall-associated NlpC family hydrolase